MCWKWVDPGGHPLSLLPRAALSAVALRPFPFLGTKRGHAGVKRGQNGAEVLVVSCQTPKDLGVQAASPVRPLAPTSFWWQAEDPDVWVPTQHPRGTQVATQHPPGTQVMGCPYHDIGDMYLRGGHLLGVCSSPQRPKPALVLLRHLWTGPTVVS